MKIDMNKLEQIAKETGFTHTAPLDPDTIELRDEVRQMCADNVCRQYNKRWSCPPGCGTLDECRKQINEYTCGILVQTVGDIEDSFDYESMKETEELHKEHFQKMLELLRKEYDHILPLGAGACTICENCTYPAADCRFPDKKISSMEAYGMIVLDVCKANHMQYYYGSDKIAYTSCFLL